MFVCVFLCVCVFVIVCYFLRVLCFLFCGEVLVVLKICRYFSDVFEG